MKTYKSVILTAVMVLTATSAFAQSYMVRPIGVQKDANTPLDAVDTIGVYDINDAGKVVGEKYPTPIGSTSRAFVWDKDSGFQLLPLLPQTSISTVGAINKNGQIVGSVRQGNYYLPIIWNPTSAGYTATLINSNVQHGVSIAINNQGDTVVKEYVPTSSQFIKTAAGAIMYFGDGSWKPHNINIQRQVALQANGHAGLWNGNDRTLTDLGVLGKNYSGANSVNDVSEVVGFSSTNSTTSPTHAFLYKNGQMKDLGLLTGYNTSAAIDINNNGQVVGRAQRDDGVGVGIVYDEKRGIRNLNTLISTPGWNIESTSVINNKGQILARGILNNDRSRPYAVMLDPMFIRGDCNSDNTVDISDITTILNYYLYGQRVLYVDACDVNDDGSVDAFDGTYLIQYLFSGGPQPMAPFPAAGLDQTL